MPPQGLATMWWIYLHDHRHYLSQTGPALFFMLPLPHPYPFPLCPSAVTAPSLPFSEGHSLILVSFNADPVTHWLESWIWEHRSPRFRKGCVLKGLGGQGQGFSGVKWQMPQNNARLIPTAHHFHRHTTTGILGIDCLCSKSPSQSMRCI